MVGVENKRKEKQKSNNNNIEIKNKTKNGTQKKQFHFSIGDLYICSK